MPYWRDPIGRRQAFEVERDYFRHETDYLVFLLLQSNSENPMSLL